MPISALPISALGIDCTLVDCDIDTLQDALLAGAIVAWLAGLVVEAKVPKPGQPKAESYEGEGDVLLRHPGTNEVERGLRWLLQNLKVDMG